MWYAATLFNVVKKVSTDLDGLKFDCPNSLKGEVRIYRGYGPMPLIEKRLF